MNITLKRIELNYVIYDKANDRMLRCEKTNNVILFSDINKAIEDLYGNEVVMQVGNLSNENKLIINNQIKLATVLSTEF